MQKFNIKKYSNNLLIASINCIIGDDFLDQIRSHYGRRLVIDFHAGCYTKWERYERLFAIWKILVGIYNYVGERFRRR